MIESYKKWYDKYGFKAINLDLNNDWDLPETQKFDIVLSFEVMEHLSISPFQHINSLSKNLRPFGNLIVSTPNLSHLYNVIKLMRGLPILKDPNLTFLSNDFEHRHIHRREYVELEVIDALTQCGFIHLKTYFMHSKKHNYSTAVRRIIASFVFYYIPRFKEIMLIIGQKS